MKKQSKLLKFLFAIALVISAFSYTVFANEEAKNPLAQTPETTETQGTTEVTNSPEAPEATETQGAPATPEAQGATETQEPAGTTNSAPSSDAPQTRGPTIIGGVTYGDNSSGDGVIVGGYDPTANPQHPNVTIPDTVDGKPVVEVGSNAFHQKEISSVTMPDSIKVINSSAFRENKLTSIKLPKELVFLGDMSFYKNEITSVTIPGKVGSTSAGRWDKYAFANNKLETVVLEEGLVTLGVAPFINNKITSITFPSTLKNISFQAFAGNALMDIEIPSTVETIEGQAFYGNGILAPKIPSTVKSMAADAFKDQGRIVESVLRDGILSYTLPIGVDASKITMTTPDVNVDVANRKITCSKDITNVNYQYSLGVYGGTEVFLPGILELVPRVEATFVDYNDAILDQKLLQINGTAQTTVIPSREGYTFIGWDKPLTNITNSTTFKAQYKALPTITTKDQVIRVGDTFNPLQDVKATDADGNAITTIKVIENTVNPSQSGKYKVTLEVIDPWGGKTTKEYQVTVEAKFFNQILTDNTSNVTVEGLLAKGAKIIVELIPTLDTALNQKLTDRNILDSYEIRIEGEYIGEINVDFPVDKELNGQTVIIYHEKKNGEIEIFERVVMNGKANVTVTELSPFVITKDKIVNVPDQNKPWENKPEENKPIENVVSKKEQGQKTNTGDTTDVSLYIAFGFISIVGIATLVYRKKKNNE